ncbi:MAG: HAD family phosphatase [Bacteroidales bacterium]|nr:HAD family phosphatase [Bacteroidales bacterium]
MIKNIVFDFGSVLVEWDPHYLYDPYFGSREKADWFLKEICPYSWNILTDAELTFPEAIAQRVALFPEWRKEIEMYYEQWIKMINPVPIAGMTEYVRELKARGYKTFGLSNWNKDTFAQVRHRFEVFDILDGMVISGQEGVKKPDPAIFKILLDRFGLKAEECVFIDDSDRNVDAARSLGFTAIRFTDRPALEPVLEPLLG